MRKFQTILLAVDFDPAQLAATAAAAQVADQFDAEVHLLHVVESFPDQTCLWPFLKQRREEELACVRDRLAQQQVGTAMHPVLAGSPIETILRQASARGVDLIVLGAGRPTATGEFQVGTVAEGVLRRASTPVLLVPPQAPAPRWQRILCPVDHSSASHAALQFAIRAASAWNAKLQVLTVVPLLDDDLAASEEAGWNQYRADQQQAWAADYERFLQQCEFGDLKWSSELRAGMPHEEILRAAREHQTDLLVMGSIGRGGLLRTLLGSVTRRVLRQLPCALFVIRDEEVVEELTAEDLAVVDLLLAEGDGLLREGAADAALVKFDQVLTHNPFHVRALEQRAAACEVLGRRAQAERARRRAAAIVHAASPPSPPH